MNPLALKLAAAGIALALAASAGFGAAWKWQAANITELELSHAEQTLSLELDARADTERQIAALQAAQGRATVAVRRIATERVATAAAGSGLRLTTAAVVQSASEDPAACPARAAALGVVFDQCVEAYIRVAELADRHAADALEQHEAAQ